MEESTSFKANLLLRLSALGAKDGDLAAIREALFDDGRNASGSFDFSTTSAVNRPQTAPLQSADPVRAAHPISYSGSSGTTTGAVNDELMSFFRREFSKASMINQSTMTEVESVPLGKEMAAISQQQSGSTTGEDDAPLPEETVRLLDSWFDFDIFDFAIKTEKEGGVLVRMGELLFDRHGFRQKYRISGTTLRSFLSQLQAGYIRDLPYHNAIHASDVAQSMSHFIVKCGLGEKGDELMRFAAIVAALGHDVGHPGYTNRYLIETRSALALTYNDKSPLENMHASKLFTTMWGRSDGKCDITSQMDRKRDVPRFRRMVIEMILATDNGQHEKVLDKVRTDCDDESVFRAAMHAADLGGGAKTAPLAHEWANRVLKEFFRQGDAERVLGLYPVLPVMDRHNPMPKGVFQEGFIKQICLPIYVTLNNVPGIDLSIQVRSLEEMARHWVADTSATAAASLRETRSFSLLQPKRSSPDLRQTINKAAWGGLEAHQSAMSAPQAARRKPSTAVRKAESSPRLNDNTSEEGDGDVDDLKVLDGEIDFHKPPILRSKSTDEVSNIVRDVRHRLNLSPRAFLSEGIEGSSGGLSVANANDAVLPSMLGASRSAVRDAVQRARAAKAVPSPPAAPPSAVDGDPGVMKAPRVLSPSTSSSWRPPLSPTGRPPGEPEMAATMAARMEATTSALSPRARTAARQEPNASASRSPSASTPWRPPVSPRSARPLSGSANNAPMITRAEAAANTAMQTTRKAAQREHEAGSPGRSPQRRRKHPSSGGKKHGSPTKKG